jgi:hypothetical protein
MADPPAPNTTVGNLRAEGQYIQALVAHWIHQDTLYWGFTKTVLASQVAILGASYALGPSLTSTAILVVGAALIGLFAWVTNRIRTTRQANVHKMNVAVEHALSAEVKSSIKLDPGEYLFQLVSVPQPGVGHRFRRILFAAAIGLDLGLALLHLRADPYRCNFLDRAVAQQISEIRPIARCVDNPDVKNVKAPTPENPARN